MKEIYTRFTNIYFFYILNQKVETDQSMLHDIKSCPNHETSRTQLVAGQK